MRLKRALDEFVVDGIETTLPLFRALAREKDIIDGDYNIHWLEEFLARGSLDAIEHDPEKWKPVFRKDHAPPKGPERDADSIKAITL